MHQTTARVLLADDQPLYREGLAATLSVLASVEVVGEAADGVEAVRKAVCLAPSVVLMDLRMPRMDGVEATRHIVREVSGCRVVALTTFDDDELVFGALQAGASGYLLKGCSPDDLAHAIRGDGAALTPSITTKVLLELRRLRAMAPPRVDVPASLSEREIQVVRLLAAGATNKDIARALGVALGTVKNHVTHVLEKLQVECRTQAALRARDLGLVR